MKNPIIFKLGSVMASCFALYTPLIAQSTAFNYQGSFNENGSPFTGEVEFQFTL